MRLPFLTYFNSCPAFQMLRNTILTLTISSTSLICWVAEVSLADYQKTDCIGNKLASEYWVYLHGWDNPQIGEHEQRNRKMFRRLAKKFNWRIALPRGTKRCNKGKRQCWATHTKHEVYESWKIILNSANQCFPTNKTWGIIGFSNGGYLVSSLYSHCLKPAPSWYVMFGAGENRVGSNLIQKPSCGPLMIAIGKKDGVYQKALSYTERLRKAGHQPTLHTFPQGHVIPEKVLTEIILSQSQAPSNELN